MADGPVAEFPDASPEPEKALSVNDSPNAEIASVADEPGNVLSAEVLPAIDAELEREASAQAAGELPGFNNPKNVIKVKPPGYKPGYGTGFLPGEPLPGT